MQGAIEQCACLGRVIIWVVCRCACLGQRAIWCSENVVEEFRGDVVLGIEGVEGASSLW